MHWTDVFAREDHPVLAVCLSRRRLGLEACLRITYANGSDYLCLERHRLADWCLPYVGLLLATTADNTQGKLRESADVYIYIYFAMYNMISRPIYSIMNDGGGVLSYRDGASKE